MPKTFLAFLTLLQRTHFCTPILLSKLFSITPQIWQYIFWKLFLANPFPGKIVRARAIQISQKKKLFPPIQFPQPFHANSIYANLSCQYNFRNLFTPIQYSQTFHANPNSSNFSRQFSFCQFFFMPIQLL